MLRLKCSRTSLVNAFSYGNQIFRKLLSLGNISSSYGLRCRHFNLQPSFITCPIMHLYVLSCVSCVTQYVALSFKIYRFLFQSPTDIVTMRVIILTANQLTHTLINVLSCSSKHRAATSWLTSCRTICINLFGPRLYSKIPLSFGEHPSVIHFSSS